MAVPFDPSALLTQLAAFEVDYVLVGGLAAVVHGSPTTTNDADIVPARDRENLERLSNALRSLGARIRDIATPDGIPFDPHPALLSGMQILNLQTMFGDLDLTFSPAALDDYGALVAESQMFVVAGIEVRVASLADVIRSKTAAGRPKDLAVLPTLHALQELKRSETS